MESNTTNQVSSHTYKGNNKYIKFLLNFQPRTVSFYEFNPMHEPKISIPAMTISYLLLSYYKRRYFLIKNMSISLISFSVNYFIYYYLIINGTRFMDYYNNNKIE